MPANAPLLGRGASEGEGDLWETINAPPISSGGSQSFLRQHCVSSFFAALSAAALPCLGAFVTSFP